MEAKILFSLADTRIARAYMLAHNFHYHSNRSEKGRCLPMVLAIGDEETRETYLRLFLSDNKIGRTMFFGFMRDALEAIARGTCQHRAALASEAVAELVHLETVPGCDLAFEIEDIPEDEREVVSLWTGERTEEVFPRQIRRLVVDFDGEKPLHPGDETMEWFYVLGGDTYVLNTRGGADPTSELVPRAVAATLPLERDETPPSVPILAAAAHAERDRRRRRRDNRPDLSGKLVVELLYGLTHTQGRRDHERFADHRNASAGV